MAQPKRSSRGTTNTSAATESHPNVVKDMTAQHEHDTELEPAKEGSRNIDELTAGVHSKPSTDLESSHVIADALKSLGIKFEASDSALIAILNQHMAIDEAASIGAQGGQKRQGSASAQACPRSGIPSAELKRKASNPMIGAEKKQKVQLKNTPRDEQTARVKDHSETAGRDMGGAPALVEAIETPGDFSTPDSQLNTLKEQHSISGLPATSVQSQSASRSERVTAEVQEKAESATRNRKSKGHSRKKIVDNGDEEWQPHADREKLEESNGSKLSPIAPESGRRKQTTILKPIKSDTKKPGEIEDGVRSKQVPEKQEPQSPELALPVEAATPPDVASDRQPQDPNFAPTLPQANAIEMVVTCNKAYIMEQMTDIEESMTRAMLSLFQENQIDANAAPKFELSPDPELENLYQGQWGFQWQSRVSKLLSRQKRLVFLRQETAFLGLLGAGIKATVFKKASLPWDVKSELGDNLEYFEQVFVDLGHKPDDVLKFVKGKQIAGAKFQKDMVAPLARKVAGSLALTLSPHIRRMPRGKKVAAAQWTEHEPWTSYLEDAIRTAITLKQNLMSSKLGPFDLTWPDCKSKIGNNVARSHYDPEGTNLANATFIHWILPGVRSKSTGEWKYAFRALVVAE